MAQTQSLITRVRTRIAAVAAVEDLQRGAAAGGAVALAVLVAQRFGLVAGTASWAAASGLASAVLVPVVGLVLRRVGVNAAAAAADERLGLRERVSTALWCRDGAWAQEPLGALVVADAEAAAARVGSADIARAFRPRVLRRPLIVAGSTALGCVALLLWQPAAQAVETPEQKLARLQDERRVAEVARKLEQHARKVAEAAEERKQETVAKVASEIRRSAQEMQRQPPTQQSALAKLNQMADRAKAEARKSAGMKDVAGTPEANEADKQLEQLLQDLSEANLESLSRDLADLEKRLAAGEKGGPKPTAEDMRALASRVDALRRALERAKESGASDIEKALRSIGNEDLLEKIAQRMRELAAKSDRGQSYESLQGEGEDGEPMDLSQLSREELEELLKQLEEMQDLDDLAGACQGAGGEARGGKKVRFGAGRPGGRGQKGQGKNPGADGESGEGGQSGSGQGKNGGEGDRTGKGGMGGPGQGEGGKAEFGEIDPSAKTEVARSKLDPKGRIAVTSFRGLPKPGQLTAVDREVLRAAREDAQAPLESDQIPRRYREGIRSWFDDLEKMK